MYTKKTTEIGNQKGTIIGYAEEGKNKNTKKEEERVNAEIKSERNQFVLGNKTVFTFSK